jgi:hypothetical protein
MIEQLLQGMDLDKVIGSHNNEGFMVYSPTDKTCYDKRLHNPSDSVPVSRDDWLKYFCGEYGIPEGKCCGWDAEKKCLCWADVTPPTLEECKATKLKDIKEEYNDLVYAGFKSDGVSYESTLENQNRIMMAKLSGGGMVVDGGLMVMLDATQANQVFDDMNSYINSCNERYSKAQTETKAATTNEQVNLVVL